MLISGFQFKGEELTYKYLDTCFKILLLLISKYLHVSLKEHIKYTMNCLLRLM